MNEFLNDALAHLRAGRYVYAASCLYHARQHADRDSDVWNRILDLELDTYALRAG